MSRGLGAWLIAGIMILGLAAEGKQYYKYRDRRGVTHFIENPNEAPREYRNQLQEVTAVVGQEEVSGESMLQHWQRRVRDWWGGMGEARNLDEELANRKLGGLIWYTLRETWLFYTLLGELLALVLLGMGLWYAQDYPTLHERRRYTLGVIVVYAVLLLTSANYLLRPQLKNFFAQSVVNADLILDKGGLVEADQARLTHFRESALTWSNHIP